MKQKIVKIGIIFCLAFLMTGIVMTRIASSADMTPDQITYPTVTINCGSITIDTQPNPDVCICSPIDHYLIDVGQSGANVKVEVAYSINCPSWDDTGYVDITFVGTTISDSTSSGEYKTGTLRITNFYAPNTEFEVKLHAKITYTVGGSEDTKYSHCSTAPATQQNPVLQLTPTSHDYSSQKVHTTSPEVAFRLENVGTGTATGSIYISDDPTDFAITRTSTGYTTFSLARNQWMTIYVVFQPQTTGSKYASLTADGSNCADVASSLSGVGTND